MFVIETSLKVDQQIQKNKKKTDLKDKQRQRALCTASTDEIHTKLAYIITNGCRLTIKK